MPQSGRWWRTGRAACSMLESPFRRLVAMATVSEILARKGTVVSMDAAESVVSAARLMN